MDALEKFIIKAKANGWVGLEAEGKKISSSRLGSYDIIYEENDYHYHDSFVGLSDFSGQEHICFKSEPVWSMCYCGYILKPDLVSASQIVQILKLALGSMYKENRFLGEFQYRRNDFEYRDMNSGDYKKFNGTERILKNSEIVYELLYFGGAVRK